MIRDILQATSIDYTTPKGNRRVRQVKPVRIYFGCSKTHTSPQWLLEVRDLEDRAGNATDVRRVFALIGVRNFL